MTSQPTRRVIGTRTGKIRHLQVVGLNSVSLGYTMCGRHVRNVVEQDATVNANCQKCIDKADLAEGMPDHRLSITDIAGVERWAGAAATCSCGDWRDEVLNCLVTRDAGGVGPVIVTHHYEHVIAAVRAGRTTTEED
jgi:hypothetical protein